MWDLSETGTREQIRQAVKSLNKKEKKKKGSKQAAWTWEEGDPFIWLAATADQAVERGKHDIVHFLVLQCGMKVNTLGPPGLEPRLLPLLPQAIHKGDKVLAEFLLSHLKTENVNARHRGDKGRTALHMAAGAGMLDVVKRLFRRHDIDANVLDDRKHSALCLAAMEGKVEVLRFLLAQVEEGGGLRKEQALLAPCGVSGVTCGGRSLLFHAIYRRQREMVALLVKEAGVDPLRCYTLAGGRRRC
jgi:hypothetical protein